MFGSNFAGNFSLPEPQYQNMDAQGGALAPNVPNAPSGNQLPGGPTSSTQPATPDPGLPGAATPTPLASPLAGGPLAAGAVPQPGSAPDASQGQAPAAGVGSPFGKPA